jgi:hypothetical protein
MTQVTVYRFRIYDASSGRMRMSHRWATRQAIEKPPFGCELPMGAIIEDSGIEVDPTALGGDGMMTIDFSLSFNRSTGG